MYPSASWSRYQQQRRAEAEALEATVGDDDDFPPFHHRQDATTEAVERLLAVMGFGAAPEGLQGPKTRRPFPRDTRSADA